MLWIVGLSLSLLEFGGFTLLCVVGLILRHHLNLTGAVILLSNGLSYGFISWMILDYLILKLREPKQAQPPNSETPTRI